VGAAAAVEGTGVAGPGVGAAVAGSGVAALGIVLADAGTAGGPDVELCPARSALPVRDPAGHGAVFWPTARVPETRNNHSHIIFVFNFV
jgi:hypothetical protein